MIFKLGEYGGKNKSLIFLFFAASSTILQCYYPELFLSIRVVWRSRLLPEYDRFEDT
jgi:hypothetical protein